MLDIQIISKKGLKTKDGIPYAIFRFGSLCYRSAVRKSMNWNERISIKFCGNYEQSLQITVKSWQNGQVHTLVGSASLSTSKCRDKSEQISIKDQNGKSVGRLTLILNLRDLQPHEMLETHEKTTTSLGYSHLYTINTYQVEDLQQFLKASTIEHASKRLRGSFLEHTTQEYLTEKEKIQHSWRRPSRPSIHVNTPRHEVDSDRLLHRKAIQRPSIAEENELIVKSSDQEQKRFIRPVLNKIKSLRPALGKKKSSIIPTSDDDDPEHGNDVETSTRQSWASSNTVRTKTLLVPSHRNILDNEQSPEMENERSFDVLANVTGESSRFERAPRRATVHLEWVEEKKK
jgi:hypothetical protein